MTNEESIQILNSMKKYVLPDMHRAEALNMAIKALEDKGYEQGYADGFAECLELNGEE